MTNADHYPAEPGYVPRSDTSEEAADSIDANALRARVLACIDRLGPAGATDDELEQLLEMRHQTVSARRRELELRGMVLKTDQRRRTRSGRTAAVYIAAQYNLPL